MRKILIIIIFFPVIAIAQTGYIITVAGTGTSGYSGDGGPATSAAVGSGLEGIVFDNVGNYYFTIGGTNEKIRKVTSGGIINTIAGTGTAGYNGDNIPATSAQLNAPTFIISDKNNNIYFSDVVNNRIRKINTITGIITTIAGNGTSGYSGDGGPATSCTLKNPSGICFDKIGNLLIADAGNYRIRQVDTNGIIHPYAGNGNNIFSIDGVLADTTSLTNLNGLCIDTVNNLYISEGIEVFKINPSTKIIYKIAGNGIVGNAGDGGPATSASLGTIRSVAISQSGELFLSDKTGLSVIRKIDVAGIIHHVAGTGVGGFNGDGILADTAQLYQPRGITFDLCGNLYLADNGNYRIREVMQPVILTTPTITLSGITNTTVGTIVTVTATVTNAGSSYNIEWFNHSIQFTTTTVPYVTYTKGAGTDTITAKVVSTATYGCYDSTTSAGHVITADPTGITRFSSTTITIYPNPANDVIHIDGVITNAHYSLSTIVGAILQQGFLSKGNNSLPIRSLPVGMYLLEINGNEGERTITKIIKQ